MPTVARTATRDIEFLLLRRANFTCRRTVNFGRLNKHLYYDYRVVAIYLPCPRDLWLNCPYSEGPPAAMNEASGGGAGVGVSVSGEFAFRVGTPEVRF